MYLENIKTESFRLCHVCMGFSFVYLLTRKSPADFLRGQD